MGKHKKFIVLIVLPVAILIATFSRVNAAATITVNSSADNTTGGNGLCTLREAITNANSDSDTTSGDCTAGSGTDTIEFDITSTEGAGPHTISPNGSPLTGVSSPMIIDGYSETGAVENTAAAPAPFNGTIMVQIDGASAGSARGFWVGAQADGSTIKGLSITRFSIEGILLEPSDGQSVLGNYIGVEPDGSTVGANGTGLSINNSDDNYVGGTDPEDRNIVSGNSGRGISVTKGNISSDDNTIEGNYVGLAADGTTALANGNDGIFTDSVDRTAIGGSAIGATNVISGNGDDGISVGANEDTVIKGNYIGTTYTGNADLGNTSHGIRLSEADSTIIGGTTASERNVISGNGIDGIGALSTSVDNTIIGNYIGVGADGSTNVGNTSAGVAFASSSNSNIVGGTTNGSSNLIRFNTSTGVAVSADSTLDNAIIGNSIYQNATTNIDLIGDGVTANDAGDGDTGPNDLLNFPEWDTVTEAGGNTEVDYTLDVPAGDYHIEFFSLNGKTLLDTQDISHTGSGSESFSKTLTGDSYAGMRMTATEIDGALFSGFGPTSEYSDIYSSGSATITVNSTADDEDDDGECTLREAITASNNDTASGDMDGECAIGAATDTIEFDITSNEGAGPHSINPGSELPTIASAGTTIDGYTETGAVENSGDYSTCFEGTIMIEIDGTGLGDSVDGIVIGADGVTVRGLAISGFTGEYADGIQINNGDGVTVAGNIIGLDTDGLVDQGNKDAGVEVNNVTDVTIGGSTAADRNLISGNDGYGAVSVNSDTGTVTIEGNCIGPDATGDAAVPNSHYGINYWGSLATNIIGGTNAGDKNVISGNTEFGIAINGTSSVETVSGNYIGTNAAGNAALGNSSSGIYIGEDSFITTIGGTTSGARNVISGNGSSGVSIDDDATVVGTIAGNYIGTNATGDADLGNSDHGVYVGSSTVTTIGGTTSGARNVISGNDDAAIATKDETSTIEYILGNYIGVGADGNSDIGNTNDGIIIYGSDTTIGGTTSGARNVISGNGESAINLSGDDNIAQGNYLGVTVSGAALGNTGSSTLGIGGNNNIIGGNTTAARNIISAGNIGVLLLGAFDTSYNSGHVIQGNYIGTNVEGEVEAGYGNSTIGVAFIADVGDVVIGGTSSGQANVIAGNGGGIGLNGMGGVLQPINNSIIGNSIYDNDGGFLSSLGIDLLEDTDFNQVPDKEVGATTNDAGDGDSGPNDYLNFPVIDSITATTGQFDVQFDLDVPDDAPNGYRIEFFANDAVDASGYGEGQYYLGSTDVASSGNDQTATISLPVGVITTGSYAISATTTEKDNSSDGFGATSEFSAALADQSIIAPLDNDGDGINDSVENAGPNSGDANGDGTPDSQQAGVATILDSTGDNYLTLELEDGGTCSTIEDFSATSETNQADTDTGFDYPLGLNSFTIPCADSVNGKIYYHAVESLESFTYRKYGPTTPGDSLTNAWYDSDFTYGTATVGSNTVATASFSLTDGAQGDDTGDDDSIVDDNGPGAPVSFSDNTGLSNLLATTGQNTDKLIALSLLLAGGSIGIAVVKKLQSKRQPSQFKLK